MNPNIQSAPAVSKTVDFDADGKQHGFLSLARSLDAPGSGRVELPVTVIRNGEGPCVTLLSGMFGDEHNGSVTLHRLARDIDPASVKGCLIILPCINPPAAETYTRLSPLDNKNLNRCFPGDANGTISERLASMISLGIVDISDVVLDIHSGKKTMAYAPTAVVSFIEDRELKKRTEESLVAFGAPFSTRMFALSDQGMLHSYVESKNKVMITAFLGSGSGVSSETLRIANTGCRNMLNQLGVLDEPIELCSTRMLEIENEEYVISAPCDGILEIHVAVGEEIYDGYPIAQIIDPSQTGAEPTPIYATTNGVLFAHHFSGRVKQGDCIAIIADVVQR